MVASQYFFHAQLEIVFPQTNGLMEKLICALFLGFTLGETRALPVVSLRALLPATGVALVLLYWGYNEVTLLAVSNGTARAALLLFVFLVHTLLGVLCANLVYQRRENDQPSPVSGYVALNYFSLASLLLVVAFRSQIGIGGFLLILASLLGLIAWQSGGERERTELRLFQAESFICGFLSFAWLALFFRARSLLFFMAGLELISYLAMAFLMYSLSPRLAKVLPQGRSPFFLSLIPLALFSAVLACLMLRNPNGVYWFQVPGPLASWVSSEQRYLIASIAGSAFLFLPYLYFAALFPKLEQRHRGFNNIFSLSAGNVLGLFLFSVVLADADLGWRLALLLMVVGLSSFLFFGYRRASATAIACLAAAALLPKSIDRHLLAQGAALRFEHRSFFPHVPAWEASEKMIQIVGKRDGEIGFLLDYGGSRKKFVLGSYSSSMSNLNDLIKAHAAAAAAKIFGPRVLVLGLGNHFSLQKLSAALGQAGRVDVVDNFSPFQETAFRDGIAEYIGFRWGENPGVQFHYADALPFLLQAERRYDLIVWNLTPPTHPGAAKMFSVEAMGILKRGLRTGGGFIASFENFPGLDCLFAGPFSHHYLIPRKANRPVAVLLATDSPQEQLSAWHFNTGTFCASASLPTWKNPFTYSLGYLRGFPGARKFREGAGLPVFAEPIHTLSQIGERTAFPLVLNLSSAAELKGLEKKLRDRFPHVMVATGFPSLTEALIANHGGPQAVYIVNGEAKELEALAASGVAPDRILSVSRDLPPRFSTKKAADLVTRMALEFTPLAPR